MLTHYDSVWLCVSNVNWFELISINLEYVFIDYEWCWVILIIPAKYPDKEKEGFISTTFYPRLRKWWVDMDYFFSFWIILIHVGVFVYLLLILIVWEWLSLIFVHVDSWWLTFYWLWLLSRHVNSFWFLSMHFGECWLIVFNVNSFGLMCMNVDLFQLFVVFIWLCYFEIHLTNVDEFGLVWIDVNSLWLGLITFK